MKDEVQARIRANPKYQKLVGTRNAYAWVLTILMLVVYYGYVLIIAFDKEWLAQRIGAGVTSLGIPVGAGVILFTVIITGIYVRRANSEFDAMTQEIIKEVTGK